MLIAILIVSSLGALIQGINSLINSRYAARAGSKDSPLYFGVMLPIIFTNLVLWWFYANSVGVMLLGVIPTVVFTISFLVGFVFAFADEL